MARISGGLTGVVVVLALAALLGLSCPGTASSTELVWEMDYSYIHFDWTGTWDEVAYYAYGFYILDIPDWAYLFALYGIGWDQAWGSYLWGTNGVWDSSDKVHLHFYSENDGLAGYAYTSTGHYYINLYYENDLDLVNGGWVMQVCTLGSVAAHETTHMLYYKYVGYDTGTDHDFLTETLAWYVGDVLWPWNTGRLDLGDVRTSYIYYMNQTGLTYMTWHDAGYYYYSESATNAQLMAAIYTFLGAGFLFVDFDYQFNNAADADGASSIYRVDDVLLHLRNDTGHDDFSGAFYFAYGYTVRMDFTSNYYLDPDSGNFNAWLYYLMRGVWYSY